MKTETRSQRGSLLRPLAVLSLAVLLGPGATPSAARAEPGPETQSDLSAFETRLEQPIQATPRRARRFAEYTPGWFGENFHFQKGAGLEYRRSLKLGDRAYELGLQGPVVRKKKRFGVTVVVRF